VLIFAKDLVVLRGARFEQRHLLRHLQRHQRRHQLRHQPRHRYVINTSLAPRLALIFTSYKCLEDSNNLP
jgi:hypothetical protein